MVHTIASRWISRPVSGVVLSTLMAVSYCGAGAAQSPPVYQTQPTYAPPGAPAPLPAPGTPVPPAVPGTPAPLPVTGGSNPGIQQFDQNSYVLGPGDVLAIELFGQPELSKSYPILIDGTVSLLMVGNVAVRGLTLKQAADKISAEYARYFRRPIVTTRLENNRPITIGVSGEVTRPGSYITPREQVPKLSFLLQNAGGITPRADVRTIQVRRAQALGPDSLVKVDLWKLIKEGDVSQDVLLRDGDSIFVPTATALSPSEATTLALTTFSPTTINVNVVGEVKRPGIQQLQPNTPLNNAILAAGGFVPTRAKTGSVRMIRLNPDGTVTDREVKIDLAQGINPESNPTMQNNDVIVIGRSSLASFSDTVGAVLEPFNGITGIVSRGLIFQRF
jgi:polysaccharide biosynthesis/export protein